ncbi:MAG: hypothetical protein V5B39_06745 [Accumulibacter sp.]
MPTPLRSARSTGVLKLDPVLCSSTAIRLLWAFAALLLLWTTVLWALD